jgi:hypothetical protein
MKWLSKDDAEFVAFAERATAGIDTAGVMVGLLKGMDKGRGSLQWFAFALQVGVCLMDEKPLLLILPTGTAVPDKLRAAATVVEYYTDGDMRSCEQATKRALEVVGLPVRH